MRCTWFASSEKDRDTQLPLFVHSQLLVSLLGPLQTTALQSLEKELRENGGGMLSSFLPEDTVLAVGSEEALRRLAASEGVTGVGEFLPEMKVPRPLRRG